VSNGGRHEFLAGQRTLLFVIRGAGRVGDSDVSARDGIFLAPGEQCALSSDEELELLVIELPSH
jgi:redox-sensitive bicupin YhaK (pirin superfamily)